MSDPGLSDTSHDADGGSDSRSLFSPGEFDAIMEPAARAAERLQNHSRFQKASQETVDQCQQHEITEKDIEFFEKKLREGGCRERNPDNVVYRSSNTENPYGGENLGQSFDAAKSELSFDDEKIDLGWCTDDEEYDPDDIGWVLDHENAQEIDDDENCSVQQTPKRVQFAGDVL